MSRILLALLVQLLALTSANAVEAVSSRPIQLNLLSLFITVGKLQHRVSPGETLSILRGERFRIDAAQLIGSGMKPDRIDLVGFAKSSNSNDDRGVWIDSATQLLSKFAVSPSGDKFSVRVYRRGVMVGEVFVLIVEPSLNYAAISVNGSVKLVRADDVLKVNAKDQFKLEKVVTNFGETADVSVRLEPVAIRNSNLPYKLFEMQLIRQGIVFARLTLQVHDQ